MEIYQYWQVIYLQWGTFTSGGTKTFPLSVSAVYSIVACKKDTASNSVPDVRSYTTTGFAYYGPTPAAWIAVCKAQLQWGKITSGKTLTYPIAFSTLYTYYIFFSQGRYAWSDWPNCTSTTTTFQYAEDLASGHIVNVLAIGK